MRLSQTKVAEKAGITRNYVAQIENGSPLNLSWVVLSRVCDALGMSLVMDVREKESEE
jgi:transcriptional regulator with XRE-family HTH domain